MAPLPALFATLWLFVGVNTHAERAPSEGAALYEKRCSSCHALDKPTTAPPVFAMKNHVIAAHPEREAFVEYITKWVNAPNAETALMPGAVRKFGVMPALGYDEAEIRTVAEWLYDADMKLPDWYKKHYEEEHGKSPEQ